MMAPFAGTLWGNVGNMGFTVGSSELRMLVPTWIKIINIRNILKIADLTKGYGRLVCYGISAIIFFHILVNIGMVIGIMPVTGIPLLLMSYGGTSLILIFTMLGIVQSINIYRE